MDDRLIVALDVPNALAGLALVALTRLGDPHPHDVDNLLDQRARVTGGVDGQQRRDGLDQIGAR